VALNRDNLATYLNDHLAGATGALELLGNAIEDEDDDDELRAFLVRLRGDIEYDRGVLEDLMAKLGIGEDRLKLTLAWLAEKAARVKLSLPIVGGHSPLTRLMQLEALTTGVMGKLSLWQVLQEVSDDPALAGFDAGRYVERAQAQLAGLEEHRRRAGRAALTR
jgi:hypothetical protein